MVNYRLITALVIVVLAFSTLFLFISSSAKNSRVEEATMMTESVIDYLKLIEQRCRARSHDFGEVQNCVEKLIAVQQIQVDVEEEDYNDYDEKKNESGFVVVINEGRNTMKSDKFILLHNREIVDQGCIIKGDIEPAYTCRLEFDSSCERGDVLEVKYGEERAYLKTC